MHVINLAKGLRVLAVAPHSDDVELGCGATLLWLRMKRAAEIHYRVLSTDDVMAEPAARQCSRLSESMRAADLLGVKNVYAREPNASAYYEARNFEDTRFPEHRACIHDYLELTKEQVDPHLVLVPSLDDSHQDHVAVAETALRVFREGQSIWHYEILQFNSGRFVPNLFIDVSESISWEDGTIMTLAERKNHILQTCFESQHPKSSLDREVIMGNMRARGQQCGRTVMYAEAFQARLSVLDYRGIRGDPVSAVPPAATKSWTNQPDGAAHRASSRRDEEGDAR